MEFWKVTIYGLLGFYLTSFYTLGQGSVSSIEFSGFVVNGEKKHGIPGVHIVIRGKGRGTISNNVGFFSLPVMTGDTLLISAVGFTNKSLIIPEREDTGFSAIINLKTDITYLPLVEVFPFPTREQFKEAFLALDLFDERTENIKKAINSRVIAKLAYSYPSANANYRNFMNRQIQYNANRFFIPSLSLTNPFAWAEFMRSLKKAKEKRKRK